MVQGGFGWFRVVEGGSGWFRVVWGENGSFEGHAPNLSIELGASKGNVLDPNAA